MKNIFLSLVMVFSFQSSFAGSALDGKVIDSFSVDGALMIRPADLNYELRLERLSEGGTKIILISKDYYRQLLNQETSFVVSSDAKIEIQGSELIVTTK